MHQLQLRQLILYCKKYDIDFQEIDNSLTYWENKKHLRKLVKMLTQTLDVFELERMAELQKQYMKEHFIFYYLACQMAGETKSTEVGQLSDSPEFSLKAFIEQR